MMVTKVVGMVSTEGKTGNPGMAKAISYSVADGVLYLDLSSM